MRRVRLSGSELETSALGFGCASVLGRVGRRDSLRALDAAFERGIRYFDVARSYGFGEAESLLGGFLRGRRDQVCIATKFGIFPPSGGPLLRVLKPLARRLAARLPRRRVSALARRALPGTQQRHFDVASAQRSLDQSLRALRTDRVDVLLLHSCTAGDLGNDDLFRFLEERVRAGAVRCYGISYEGEDLHAILPLARTGVRVLQVPARDGGRERRELLARQQVAVVTHSLFGRGGALARLESLREADPDRARRASQELGVDVGEPGTLARLLLCDALRANPDGVVLCSMFDPRHIAANAECAARPPFSDATLDAFRAWAEPAPAS